MKSILLIFLALVVLGCGNGVNLKPGEYWQNGKIYRSSTVEDNISLKARSNCGIAPIGRAKNESQYKCWSKEYDRLAVAAGIQEANPKSSYGNHRIGVFYLTRDEINKIKLACKNVSPRNGNEANRDRCLKKEIKKIPRKVEWKSER